MERSKYISKENCTVIEIVDMIIEDFGPSITVGINNSKDAYGFMGAAQIKHQLEFERTLENFSHWADFKATKLTFDYTENIVGKHITFIEITCKE